MGELRGCPSCLQYRCRAAGLAWGWPLLALLPGLLPADRVQIVLTGPLPGGDVGGITALPGGNFVVSRPGQWPQHRPGGRDLDERQRRREW